MAAGVGFVEALVNAIRHGGSLQQAEELADAYENEHVDVSWDKESNSFAVYVEARKFIVTVAEEG